MAGISKDIVHAGPYVPFTLSSTSSDIEPRYLVAGPKPITIGRASKHESRGAQARPDNAAFECPVVSRDHAVIDTKWNSRKKTYDIIIKDLGSLHGTFVNGQAISAHSSYALCDGDLIELGANVARGSDTFKGVTVVFKTDYDDGLVYDTYSGYSVPSDSESEDVSDYGGSSELADDIDATDDTDTSPHSQKELGSEKELARSSVVHGSQDKPIDLDSFRTGSLRQVFDIAGEAASAQTKPLPGAPTMKPDHMRQNTWLQRGELDCADEGLDITYSKADRGTTTAAESSQPTMADIVETVSKASHDVFGPYTADETDEYEQEMYENDEDGDMPSEDSVELGGETFSSSQYNTPPKQRFDSVYDGPSSARTGASFHEDLKLPPMRPAPWMPPPGMPLYKAVYPMDLQHAYHRPYPPFHLPPLAAGSLLPPAIPHSTALETQAAPPANAGSIPEPAIETANGKHSVQGADVDTEPQTQAFQWSTAPQEPSSNAVVEDAAPGDSAASSNKRKRQEETNAQSSDSIAELLAEYPGLDLDLPAPRPKKKAKMARSKSSSSVLRDLRKYALGAALGATGTITLLASPLGGMLADWAASA